MIQTREQTITGSIVILGSVVIALLFPLAAPIIGIALTAGGLVVYRRATEGMTRTLGAMALVAGIVVLLIFAIFALGFYAVRVGGS